MPGMAAAQPETVDAGQQSLPASVVLVLKLVSRDYVKPTTGIVISADGMVMVPAAFVSQGDEIVVLDGGTDILRYGRPAKTIRRSAADGLAILKVEGLARRPVVVAEHDFSAHETLHFAAFPPAEKIAAGAPPVWLPVGLSIVDGAGQLALAADSTLPEVTGALFDRCGYLAGLRPTTAEKKSTGESSPALLPAGKISQVLKRMQVNYLHAGCGVAGQQDNRQIRQKPGVQPVEEPAPKPKAPIILQPPEVGADKRSTDTDTRTDLASAPATADLRNHGQVPVLEPTTARPVVIESSRPDWILWFALIMLAAWLWLVRRSPPTAQASTMATGTEEPATADLKASPAIDPHRVSGGLTAEPEIPAVEDLPAAFDGMVVIEGTLANGDDLRRYCGIDSGPLDVLIGRGNADLTVQAAGISRAHARLGGQQTALTLTDLGSSNGTFIRGIPCLRGESMYIGPDDEVLLGDVQVKIRVIMKPS